VASHPERSEAESKDPVARSLDFITGFLDFARNDEKRFALEKSETLRLDVCPCAK
jgi:hypothetical protein